MSNVVDRLRAGVVSARQLADALGVSPPTMMRYIRAEGPGVVRIGSGRATRYGLRREVPNLGSELPAFRVDEGGVPHVVGRLVMLSGGQTAWLPQGVVFDGLPPEVFDMRPSGFMGRAFPRRHPELALPPRVSDWSDDAVLLALGSHGDDLAGNLVLGDESMKQWFESVVVSTDHGDYDELARAAIAGDPPGSSAGGERPKFGAYVGGRHVLVKFAARGQLASERWCELLKLEAIALDVLREHGVEAVEASISETDAHVFLEVPRFDRIGARGRRATVTLFAAEENPASSWAQVATQLAETRRLSDEDAVRLKLYDAYARLIANSDRHHGNVALFPEYDGDGESMRPEPTRYQLAPAFDQLPMLYAPTSDGQVPARRFDPPRPTSETWSVWSEAAELATTFWGRAREDVSMSKTIREIAERHLNSL